MVEHSLCMRGARGSIPRTSIFFIFDAIDLYDINILNIDDMRLPMRKTIQKTTTAGFEPTLPKGNCLAGNRLNHSATLSYTLLLDRLLLPLSSIDTTKTFLKKRQWQDLNLRIQRIIDFKSIALDHSATLSSTHIIPIGLLVQVSI